MIQVLITPLLVIALALCLGLVGLRLQFRSQVETQARLDRCVRDQAIALRDSEKLIVRSNGQITAFRAAKVAAGVVGAASLGVLAPEAAQAIKMLNIALNAEVVWQELLEARHILRAATWLARFGCDGKRDLFKPYPGFGWERPEKDFLGPKPLEWKGPKTLHLFLEANHRIAHARVELEHEGKPLSWTAYWAAGTDFR